MPELRLSEIARILGVEVDLRLGDPAFREYTFDSRKMGDQSLFFAMRSPSGDGHDYVRGLNQKPGSGAVVAMDFTDSDVRIPLIRVPDPLAAAIDLARRVRENQRNCKYIALTGSAGKTTTKEFLFQIISTRRAAYRSPLNWNNQLGMPFSLLMMTGQEEAAVFELGMSDPGIGEITALVEVLRPDLAAVLNIYPVHLEYLKTMENIARAKCEIFNRLAADGCGLVNGDFDLLRRETAKRPGEKIYFGSHDGNDITLRAINRKGDRTELVIDFYGISQTVVTSLVNRAHLENLFAAIVICRRLGLKIGEIATAVHDLQPVQGRGVVSRRGGFEVIDETYNSNPEALKMTLSWVSREYERTKTAVVGDMLELGENEADYHRQAGEWLATLRFDRLVTVGNRARWIAEGAVKGGFPQERVHSFTEPAEAGRFLRREAEPGEVILFKASRGVRLERAIEALDHD